MEVEIGKEGLKFENGAFTYYGVSALTLPSSGEFRNSRKTQRDNYCFLLIMQLIKMSVATSLFLFFRPMAKHIRTGVSAA